MSVSGELFFLIVLTAFISLIDITSSVIGAVVAAVLCIVLVVAVIIVLLK